MNEKTNPGCSRRPVLPKSSSSSCTICSLTPPSISITTSCGEVFCSSCLLYALIQKHQDGHQEPANQDPESRHEGDLDVDSTADVEDDAEVLVQKELSETRREQLQQLQQLEDHMEQLKTTLVCALGLASLEDRACIDESIAKERLETRRHEGDLDVDSTDDVEDDVEVLVQKELSETRCEQIKQLQQLEDHMEQLKTTLVCALGLASLEDRAWIDESIAKERLKRGERLRGWRGELWAGFEITQQTEKGNEG